VKLPQREAQAAVSNFEGVDTVILYNELAYHDVLPVGFEPINGTPEPFRMAGIEEANLLLLQACVAVEELPLRQQSEDAHPLSADLARIDFKLNLVLQLLAKLTPPDKSSAAVRVRFNAIGVSFELRGVPPAVGQRGLVRIRLRGSLPQTLDMYAEITENMGAGIAARFIDPSPAVTELLQKLCFLMHRKQVAGSRKSRNS
jgi:hypothetical protein